MLITIFFFAIFISVLTLAMFVVKLSLALGNKTRVDMSLELVLSIASCILWTLFYYFS